MTENNYSPTSVNCSSRVRWSDEKLSSEISVSDGFAGGGAMHRDAFHVVDLIAHVGLDQRRAVDQRARLDRGERDAADAHGDAARRRKAALQQQQIAGGRIAQSLTSKSSLRLTEKRAGLAAVDQKGADVAVRVEAALGDRDQRAGERRALRRRPPGIPGPCCW